VLTRLKVKGFKNLLDVDVRFGPFTCIAGPNGVGKSNLMDAIRFLSLLSNGSLAGAAAGVRDTRGRGSDPRSLFYNFNQQESPRMDFEVEMIAPREATDDVGKIALAEATFLRYQLSLGWSSTNGKHGPQQLAVLGEQLEPIAIEEASHHLRFAHAKGWSESNLRGAKGASPFIETDADGKQVSIGDGTHDGHRLDSSSENRPSTVLKAAGGFAIFPTIVAVRREMQSWRSLQLEPSSLRSADEFRDPQTIGSIGEHMPATLFRIANSSDSEVVYAQLANRLAELVGDIESIEVDRDEARELLTLYLTQRDGSRLPARALSDGTLRFLALAVLSMDPEANSLVCLEEPENGVHPRRIPAMIDLLRDLAADPTDPDEPNPLRQVIFTTHSPLVVKQCPEDSVIFAHTVNVPTEKGRGSALGLSCLPGTWREEAGMDAIGIGTVVNYLEPMPRRAEKGSPKRVIDRADIQMALGFDADEQEH
jgi:predicted ATPase